MLEQVSSEDNNYVYLVVQNSLNLPVLGNMQHSGYIASMIAESELPIRKVNYRCGYVGIPKTNNYHGVNFECINYSTELFIELRELTYSGNTEGTKYAEQEDYWWFGFDYAQVSMLGDREASLEEVLRDMHKLGDWLSGHEIIPKTVISITSKIKRDIDI